MNQIMTSNMDQELTVSVQSIRQMKTILRRGGLGAIVLSCNEISNVENLVTIGDFDSNIGGFVAT